MVEIVYAAILIALLEALFRACQEATRLDWEMVWWSLLGKGGGYLMHAVPRLDAVVLAIVLLLVWLTYSVLILETQSFRSEADESMLMDLGVAIGIYFTGSALRNMQQLSLVEADMAWLGLALVFVLVYLRGVQGFHEMRGLVGSDGTLARRLEIQNAVAQLIRLTRCAAACAGAAYVGWRYDRSTLQGWRNIDTIVQGAAVYSALALIAMFVFSPTLRTSIPEWKWLRSQERPRLGRGLLTAIVVSVCVQLFLLGGATTILRLQNAVTWSGLVLLLTVILARTVVRFDTFLRSFLRTSQGAYQKGMANSIRDLARRLYDEDVAVRLFEDARHTPRLALEVGKSTPDQEREMREIADAILEGREVPVATAPTTRRCLALKGIDEKPWGVLIVSAQGGESAFLGNSEVQAVLEGIATQLVDRARDSGARERMRFVPVRVAR